MDYMIVGFVILVLLCLFNIIGKMMTLRFNLSFRFNIPLGYVFALAVSQMVGVPAIMLHVSTNVFTMMYLITMVVILFILGVKVLKNRGHISQLFCLDNKYELRSKKQWISAGLLLLGVFFIYINIMQQYRIDRMSDSAFYIPHILGNVSTDHIYSLNPWSGASEPFNSLYLYVTYELFHGMLIHLFSMNGLLYINHGMTFIIFVMIMMCIVELAMKLFNQKKAILSVVFWLFVTFIFVVNISDNYFFFFSTDMIERLPYTGKVLAYLALVPMFYTCLIEFFNVQKTKKAMTWMLILLNLAIMSLTSTGLFVVGIEYVAILFFLLWSKRKRFDEVLLLTLSTWPLLLFVILAKFSSLAIPVILCYLILFFMYKKQVQFIYPLMKYVLLIGSLLIPLVSLALQFLDGRLGLTVFSASEFFSRLLQSLDTNTTIIWIISVLGLSFYLRNKDKDETNQLLFGKVPLYICVVFINPISCAFVSTFLTSTSVYHRLFYSLPLFPLLAIFIVTVVDKLKLLQPKQSVYTMAMSGLMALLIYQSYTGIGPLISSKLLNRGFSYKNMVSYVNTDNAQMLNEFVPENSRVAMYFSDNLWADELRSLRSLSPHVILPYNTNTHRCLTGSSEYSEEDYYNNQIMMLLNGSMSFNDLFIDENGVLTEMTNGEVLLDYLLENYDYLVLPRYAQNKEFLRELFKLGKKVIAKTDRDYLIEL